MPNPWQFSCQISKKNISQIDAFSTGPLRNHNATFNFNSLLISKIYLGLCNFFFGGAG